MTDKVMTLPKQNVSSDFSSQSKQKKSARFDTARSTARRALTSVASLAGFVVLWELLVRLLDVPAYLLPAPTTIFYKAVVEWRLLWEQSLSTSQAIVFGFLSACAVGILLAAAMVFSKRFEQMIYPILIVAQVMPKVALVPLFIVWFGYGLLPKVVMTFLIAVFPIVIDTLTGLSAVRPESLMLLRSMGATRWMSFWKVRLPTALPYIFSGLKIGITLAVVGAIVAEFVASDAGLGFVLIQAQANLDTVLVFAAIIWLIALGFFFFFLTELAELLLVHGRNKRRGHELGRGL